MCIPDRFAEAAKVLLEVEVFGRASLCFLDRILVAIYHELVRRRRDEVDVEDLSEANEVDKDIADLLRDQRFARSVRRGGFSAAAPEEMLHELGGLDRYRHC